MSSFRGEALSAVAEPASTTADSLQAHFILFPESVSMNLV